MGLEMNIYFIGNSMWSMWNFRRTVINSFGSQIDSTVIAPFDGYEKNFDPKIKLRNWEMGPKNKTWRKEFLSIISLGRLFRPKSDDITVCYGVKPILYCSTLRLIRRRGSHYVYLFAGLGEAFTSNQLIHKIVRFALGFLVRNAVVIALNPSDYHVLLKANFRNCNVRLFDGEGLDVSDFHCTRDTKARFDFIFVGRLIEAKGIRDFLHAVINLRSTGMDVQVCVLGDFYHADKDFEDEIRSLMSTASVEFLGFVENPMDYIAQARFLTLPSLYGEGVPRTVIEAMTLGVVPIVYSNPGVDHIIENGVVGLMSEPDIDQLTNVMINALELSPTAFQFQSENCIEMSRRFDLENVLTQYRDIFSKFMVE